MKCVSSSSLTRLAKVACLSFTLLVLSGCATQKGTPTALDEGSSTFYEVGDEQCVTYKAVENGEIACFNKEGIFVENRKPLTQDAMTTFKETGKTALTGAFVVGLFSGLFYVCKVLGNTIFWSIYWPYKILF